LVLQCCIDCWQQIEHCLRHSFTLIKRLFGHHQHSRHLADSHLSRKEHLIQ